MCGLKSLPDAAFGQLTWHFCHEGPQVFDWGGRRVGSWRLCLGRLRAILRGRQAGKQLVVVGDNRQMPPTDFFGRDMDVEDEESSTADIESILSLCMVAGCPERYLRWHYRSRHETLIAVSPIQFFHRLKLMALLH